MWSSLSRGSACGESGVGFGVWDAEFWFHRGRRLCPSIRGGLEPQKPELYLNNLSPSLKSPQTLQVLEIQQKMSKLKEQQIKKTQTRHITAGRGRYFP